MKNLVTLLLLLTFSTIHGQNTTFNLIPKPAEIQILNGVFRLTVSANIVYNNPDASNVAEMLSSQLNRATGFSIKARKGNSGTIMLNLNANHVTLLGNEGYILEVSAKNVTITANQPAGLFYGIQTLLQLLPPEIESLKTVKADWTIPAVKITDYPRFQWRGIMLDVSRNFFTKEEVKEYIDQISRYKYNTFHWHLTDDNGWRIEIKSLPKLTEIGACRVPRGGHFNERLDPQPGEEATDCGFYTQEDIKEIIQYAQDRFITIVPEIDVPGHSMAAIASYPELCCTQNPDIKVNPGTNFAEWYGNGTFRMFIDNTLNPSSEKVYEFLDKVFTEVADLFPNPYIHVGGDECYKGFWEADEGCRALMKKLNTRHVEDLQGYFMNRVEKILEAKGKKLLGWDEILEGGISPNATLMSWRGMAGGIEAAKMGHDVVMTPTNFAYLDYMQGDPTIEPPIYASLRLKTCYSFNPVPDNVDPEHILGGQGNLWSEQLPTMRHAEYMTWPRGWALSEVFWTPQEERNWDDFINRVEKQFVRSEIAELNYSKALYDPVIKVRRKDGKLVVDMETEALNLDIFYTVDDAMPDNYSKKYTSPFALPEGGPVTLRVITYRNNKPVGHLITLSPDELRRRQR